MLQGFPEYQTLLMPTWALGLVMLRETLLRSRASSGMAPGLWRREVVERALLEALSAVFPPLLALGACWPHVHLAPLGPGAPGRAHGAGDAGSAQHIDPFNARAMHLDSNSMAMAGQKKL